MEDILASIRRILSEDEAPAQPAVAKPTDPPGDVLSLDASMIVQDSGPTGDHPAPAGTPNANEMVTRFDTDATEPTPDRPSTPLPAAESKPVKADLMERIPEASYVEHLDNEGLVAPEAAAAAAGSVHSLLRKLAEQRAAPVYRNGPTLEDIVREEMRPLLKTWLDTHVPEIVERHVRAEIERVVNRAVP
jgi:cell pole-organizing protein PopZ